MEAAQNASSSGSCLCPQSGHDDKSEKDARTRRLASLEAAQSGMNKSKEKTLETCESGE